MNAINLRQFCQFLLLFTTSICYSQTTDLSITKVVNDPNPTVGAMVTFTLTATNNGPNVATGVTVLDLLPAGYTFVTSAPSVGTYLTGTWTIGNLISGASGTLSIVASVNSIGPYNNCATISGSEIDPVSTNNTSCATTSPIPLTNLEVIKTVNNANPVVGTNVVFTITAMNIGPSSASGVLVTDLLPSGYTYVSSIPSVGSYDPVTGFWLIGTMTNSMIETLDITATVMASGVYQNCASISGNQIDPDQTNNTSCSTPLAVPSADLSITNIVSNGAPTVGSTVVFTLTAINSGPSLATGTDVNDLLPSGYTYVSSNASNGSYNSATGVWAIGNLVSGVNETLDITCTVNATGNYQNCATIASSVLDQVPGNNLSCMTVNVGGSNVAPVANNDLFNTNEDTPITFNVTNNDTDVDGIVDVTSVDLSTLTGIQDTVVNVFGTWVATTTGDVIYTPFLNFCGTAQIDYTVIDDDGAVSNLANISVNVVCVNDAPIVDNEFVITPQNTPVTGDLTDNGDFDVEGPLNVMGISLPPTNGVISLGIGGSFTYIPNPGFVGADTAIATVCDQGFPMPIICVNDTIFISVFPVATTDSCDISLTKAVSDLNPIVGDTIDFTLTVSNLGPDVATNVILQDALPSGYIYISSSSTTGAYNASSGLWVIDTMLNTTTEVLDITVSVNPFGVYQNCANVGGDQFDQDFFNNVACITPTIQATIGCVNGTVFCDYNNNGIQESGELGVPNAPISANYNGTTINTVSNSNGNYNFSFNLSSTAGPALIGVSSVWLSQNGYYYTTTSDTVTFLGCGNNAPVNFPVNCDSVMPLTNCVAGYVFCDANGNGIMDSSEVALVNAPVQINASGLASITSFTDSTGYYNFSTGTTNLFNAVVGVPYYYLAQNGMTMSPSSVFVGTDCSSGTLYNLAVTCPSTSCVNMYSFATISGWYFQNQPATLNFSWGATGLGSPQPYTLTLSYPAVVTPITSTISNANYTISGNTITWSFPAGSFGSFNMFDQISFMVPPGLANGVQHTYTSTITPTGSIPECDSTNNSYSWVVTVGASYDPNDKAVNMPLSINPDVQDELTYNIRFQNTGTAPAQDVYVLDTLSPNLDWTSFKVLYFSHNMNVISLSPGVKKFDFPGIWLPDSTSNESESHGMFIYSIKEKANNPVGSTIENTAHIYFDWNPAIVTNTTFNINSSLGLGDNQINEVSVYPNPFTDNITIESAKRMDKISVLDITGKMILAEDANGFNSNIRMDRLPRGIYFIKVSAGTETSTIRVVKE